MFGLRFILILVSALTFGDAKMDLILFVNTDEIKVDGVFDLTIISTEFSIKKFFRAMYCLRIHSGSLSLIVFYLGILKLST